MQMSLMGSSETPCFIPICFFNYPH